MPFDALTTILTTLLATVVAEPTKLAIKRALETPTSQMLAEVRRLDLQAPGAAQRVLEVVERHFRGGRAGDGGGIHVRNAEVQDTLAAGHGGHSNDGDAGHGGPVVIEGGVIRGSVYGGDGGNSGPGGGRPGNGGSIRITSAPGQDIDIDVPPRRKKR